MSFSKAINSDDDSRYETAVSLLEDLIELMPFDERDPYLQAVNLCPEVVKRETDPLEFLRFESFDILKATKRLLKYWELRIDLFGERAFRPMFDLSGGGVMDEELIEILKTGRFAILPKDRNGDLVVHIDTRRAGKIFFDLSQHKGQAFCFWMFDYFRFRLKQDCDTSAGIVIIQRLEEVPKLIVKSSVAKILHEAMPYQVKAMRAVIVAEKLEQKIWTQAFLPKLKEALLEKIIAVDEVTVHTYKSHVDMKLELLSFGLSEKGLPPSLGGTWSYENFTKDIQKLQGMSSSVDDPLLRSGHWFERWQQYKNTLSKEKCIFPLDNALMSIPFEDRLSYTEAKKRLPDLVKQESYQKKFYHFYNFDEAKAALQLARLWTLRERLFLDRVYLPMNQLGTGSLSKTDTQILNTGFLMMLPNDSNGNFVISYDPSKASGSSFASQRRCLFYMMFLVLRDLQQESGAVRFLCHFTHEEASKKSTKTTFSDILEVFPIQIADFNVILDPEGLQDTIHKEAVKSKMFTLFEAPPDQTIFHEVCPDMDSCDIYLCLSRYGFSEEGVPPSFYGNFTDESFLIWQDEMIAREAVCRSKVDNSIYVYRANEPEESKDDGTFFTRYRKRGDNDGIESNFSMPPTFKKSSGSRIHNIQGSVHTGPAALHRSGTTTPNQQFFFHHNSMPFVYYLPPSPFFPGNFHLGQPNHFLPSVPEFYQTQSFGTTTLLNPVDGDNGNGGKPTGSTSLEQTSTYRRSLADYWRMKMKGETR